MLILEHELLISRKQPETGHRYNNYCDPSHFQINSRSRGRQSVRMHRPHHTGVLTCRKQTYGQTKMQTSQCRTVTCLIRGAPNDLQYLRFERNGYRGAGSIPPV